MPFKIYHFENYFIDTALKQSLDELNIFFEINWVHHLPKVFVLEDRKTFNEFRGEKTEPWVVGFTHNRDICVLNPEKFSKESNHIYSEKYYRSLIKHELVHCFYLILSKNNNRPTWLWEGAAIYLSGQNEQKKKITKFANVLDFFDKHVLKDISVYSESGYFVEKLVNKFGKDKLIEFIKATSEIKDETSLIKIFKTIFSFDLNYDKINQL